MLPATLVLDVSSIVQWPCRKPDTPIDRRCHRVVYEYVCRWECVASCQIATGKRLGCELRGTFADCRALSHSLVISDFSSSIARVIISKRHDQKEIARGICY